VPLVGTTGVDECSPLVTLLKHGTDMLVSLTSLNAHGVLRG
jgi:hypothetical protein